MDTLARLAGPLAVGLACLLMPGTDARTQDLPPRSTGNPDGGLRGASARGVALRGASTRPVSGRITSREFERPAVVDPEFGGASGGTSRPTPPTGPVPAPPGGAARPAPAPVGVGVGGPPDRFRPRLLTPATGPVLRGDARLTSGRWTVRTARGDVTLDAGDVRRVVLERDLLDQFRARRARVDPTAPAERLELARWSLAQGLVAEGLDALDQLLQRADTAAAARDVLACAELPALLGPRPDAAALDVLLDDAARGSPAEQERALLALIPYGARHRNELERRLVARLDAPRAADRDFAGLALRRLFRGVPQAPGRSQANVPAVTSP